MHEASIAESIINYLIDYEKKYFFKINSVTIEIGKVSGINKDSLSFCLNEVAKVLGKDWNFDFIEKPLVVKCRRCNAEYELEEISFHCVRCEDAIPDIISGDQLNIYELEGEEIES